MLKRPVSNFDIDAATTMWSFKAAIERGGATRVGINNGLETKIRGLVTPAGRVFLSKVNHQGIQLDSMWVGAVQNCKVKPSGRRGLREEEVASSLVVTWPPVWRARDNPGRRSHTARTRP